MCTPLRCPCVCSQVRLSQALDKRYANPCRAVVTNRLRALLVRSPHPKDCWVKRQQKVSCPALDYLRIDIQPGGYAQSLKVASTTIMIASHLCASFSLKCYR